MMMLQGRVKPVGTGPSLATRRNIAALRPVAARRQLAVSVQSAAAPEQPFSNNSLSDASHPPPGPNQAAPRLPITPQPLQQQEQQQHWRLNSVPEAAAGGGSGSSGGSSSGGGGGGGGGGGDNSSSDDDDDLLDLEQAEAAAAAAKVQLPADMLETAKSHGIRSTALSKYLSLQSLAFAGGLVQRFPWIRDRMIADNKFLFKVVAEVVIDSGCATVAEVRKRGDDFWQEFEFYLSDLLVGIVMDVVLVSLMAPVAVLGGSSAALGRSALQKWLATIPSAALEASVKGVKEYTVGSRFACLGVKFLEYSLAGITCGFIGQGIANSLMLLKRQIHGEKEDDVAVPPLVKTALVWGLFMGVSSNLRYQAVFGLERAVDMTIAKRVPAIAYGTTVAIRFVNNVIGGENFIDMARWAGVQ